MAPRVCLVMSRMAWWIVSGWLAHSCSSRSPCSQAGSGESLGKARIGVSFFGLRRGEAVPVVEQAGPDRHGHGQPVGRDRRAEHVAVGGGLADAEVGRGAAGGEEPGPAGEGLHQAGQLGPAAGVQSNAAKQANGCLAAGAGVSTPAW